MYYLESILGGPSVFEPYLKAHVEKFSHKSITTHDFYEFIFEFYGSQPDKLSILKGVNWEGWFHGEGMPLVENTFDDSLAQSCISLALEWEHGSQNGSLPNNKSQFDSLNSNQKIMFLEKMLLKPPFPTSTLSHMMSLYDMKSIQNAEIKFRWLWLCLKSEWELVFKDVEAFITSVGRMNFIGNVYFHLLIFIELFTNAKMVLN